MDADDLKMSKVFEAALRDVGGSRLCLNQVVKAYQQAFPAESMRPDMRTRLHDAIAELSRTGVINIAEDAFDESETSALPKTIEIAASANFVRTPDGILN